MSQSNNNFPSFGFNINESVGISRSMGQRMVVTELVLRLSVSN